MDSGEKVVIFTQWLKMAELVEEVLEDLEIEYVYLNGNVPTKNRKKLIYAFQKQENCKVFLSTDAGGLGLNLQKGSVVINLDLPWNPAVLEQRIGRVHRLGQMQNVQVINLISGCSIEARIFELLKFKKAVFSGALDEDGQDVVMVSDKEYKGFMEEIEKITKDLEEERLAEEEQSLAEEEWLEEYDEGEEEEWDEERIPVGSTNGKLSSTAVKIEREGNLQNEQIGQLLQAGAAFLSNLGKILEESSREKEKAPSSPYISRDEKSGETFLKIPIPPKEKLKNLWDTLGDALTKIL
ncbi:MAG: hypothetical protein D6785_06690 [Planctomycetota bacterium]|nr:MAG: hypothetical protein D6785_06690 [Planctomycetota bacterium]